MSYNKHYAREVTSLGNSRLPSDITSEAVLRFFESLDCPKSLAAALLFKYGEYEQLLGLEAIPKDYCDSISFRDAYQAVNFLSKSNFLETKFDRKQLALNKFLAFEENCRSVNNRFRSDLGHQNEFGGHGALLSAMRCKIDSILGDFSIDEFLDLASWGPGVSTLIKGEDTSGSKKFQCETGITRDLYPLASILIREAYPGWSVLLAKGGNFPVFQVGNQVITVPKTSKIDRVIAVEPGINLWFQMAVGRMIRKRLGKVGIDLTDQSRNQRYARLSSKTGHLATVDFSSASDSIATELVRTLFDFPKWKSEHATSWFDVMDVCRSQYGILNAKVMRWNKFSSMGNGFTFDLETLIFYVAAVVCCESLQLPTHEVSVYGDDVILPTEAFDLFRQFSKFLGFSVNTDKSFFSGSFRESCGSHYYAGVDCKPVFLKERLSTPQRVYIFANTVRLRSHNGFYGCDVRFRSMFYWCQKALDKRIRFKVSCISNALTGELEPSEGGFISNFDEACPRLPRDGTEMYLTSRLAWVAVKQVVETDGHLISRLFGLTKKKNMSDLRFADSLADGNFIPLRGRVRCVLLKNASFRQWYDLGPWL